MLGMLRVGYTVRDVRLGSLCHMGRCVSHPIALSMVRKDDSLQDVPALQGSLMLSWLCFPYLGLGRTQYLLATCQHPTEYSPSFPTLAASSQPCTALQPQGLELLKKGDALKSVSCTVLKYGCKCCQCLDTWLGPF